MRDALEIMRKFLVKLFSKSFKERRLFEKRRHPDTFIAFLSTGLSGAERHRQAWVPSPVDIVHPVSHRFS
ncbi:hypothetical protein CFR76_03475 [Komagataeibacter swingsii]|uniref:Uncharacterized protein n=1 Tax=Komagataeibacter swingsii TaxID=215220 RepID=A0A2V4RN87_9PROT|nr:hypothetical protein CFR76_03475 [Komagataeibacter swingsii]